MNPSSTMQLVKYTAIFHSSTGPAMAHVMSVDSHSRAWCAVGHRYMRQGRLVGLIPGHHSVVMQGATMGLNREAPEVILPGGPDDLPARYMGNGEWHI